MSQVFANSLAALAAVILAVTSISTIAHVPAASAHMLDGAGQITELA